MFISEQEKFIFFHPMKTGGQTTRHRLLLYNLRPYPRPIIRLDLKKTKDEKLKIKERRQKWKSSLKNAQKKYEIWHPYHLTYRFLEEYPNVIPEEFHNYFKFTFVRNPYDRMYSFFLQMWNFIKPLIPEAAEDKDSKPADYFKPIPRWYYHPDFKNKLQHIPFRNTPQYLFTHNSKLENQMNYIGRLEKYENDYDRVIEIINPSTRFANKRREPKTRIKNVRNQDSETDGYKYLDQYDQESLDFVNQHFQKDFEFFYYRIIEKIEDVPEAKRFCSFTKELGLINDNYLRKLEE